MWPRPPARRFGDEEFEFEYGSAAFWATTPRGACLRAWCARASSPAMQRDGVVVSMDLMDDSVLWVREGVLSVCAPSAVRVGSGEAVRTGRNEWS